MGSVTRTHLVTCVGGFTGHRCRSQKARVKGQWEVRQWRQHFVKRWKDQTWGKKEWGCGHIGFSEEEVLLKWQDRDKVATGRCGYSGFVTEAIKRKIIFNVLSSH